MSIGDNSEEQIGDIEELSDYTDNDNEDDDDDEVVEEGDPVKPGTTFFFFFFKNFCSHFFTIDHLKIFKRTLEVQRRIRKEC